MLFQISEEPLYNSVFLDIATCREAVAEMETIAFQNHFVLQSSVLNTKFIQIVTNTPFFQGTIRGYAVEWQRNILFKTVSSHDRYNKYLFKEEVSRRFVFISLLTLTLMISNQNFFIY